MTPASVAEPLPECPLCERPVRRDVAAENGGLCKECSADAIGMVLFQTPRYLPAKDDR